MLDIGGYEYYWSFLEQKPRVTIVNLDPPAAPSRDFDWVIADALRLPFANRAFEVVFSNSVIEHVPGWRNRERFAHELRRVGRSYYVQTPNRWFPIEPHLMTPLIHFLPAGLQKKLLRNFTVWGWLVRPTQQGCNEFVDEVCMLDERDLRLLFPEAETWKERALGLTKSLMAVFR